MPKTLYSPKEKKAQYAKNEAGLIKTQLRQRNARPVPIGVPSEDRRGEIVQVFSSRANMVCSAEIIHLPGDDDLTGAKKVPAGHFGVQYAGTHGCPHPAYKIVKESEMFSPCKGQKDGAKPGDCPATRPLCKQEVCAGLTVGKLDPHAQSKEERKRRETSGSNLKGAHNRSARERRMREVAATGSEWERELAERSARIRAKSASLVVAAPPAIKEEEEEVEEEEEEEEDEEEEPTEEEVAAAREIFERAVDQSLMQEELGGSRPDLGPVMFEERFEEMDRKKEEILEHMLGGNIHIDAAMYYEKPWGQKLFDDVLNKKVTEGIARRQAAVARVIFKEAVERALLGEELGVSRPDLGPAMFEERFGEMNRKKADLIEQLLGGNLHIDALMYYEKPWGQKLFDDVWNEVVAAGIARRQADDVPDEPMAGGRPNRMRKTKKKKKKTKKKSKKKTKKTKKRRS